MPLLPVALFFFLSTLLPLFVKAHLVHHDGSFVPDYILRATAQNISIDCQSRYSVLLNGTSPGPPLYLKENQTSWIRVYNDMPGFNVTVHWHGLSQRSAPFSDGTPQVSQWPIPSFHYFDYEIRPEIGDAGSYFYHSHVGFQAVTATGPMIVEDLHGPPYTYEDERILEFTDYYNQTDVEVQDGLLANPFVWSGETNGLVLNGQTGSAAGNVTTAESSCAPARIKVKPGSTYRFRWIGRTAISLITLGIEDHSNFTIIEADGTYTQPYTTDHLQIATGQRFSTFFKAKSLEEIQAANKTLYWLQMENRERPANVTNYAILEYEVPGSPFVLPNELPSPKPLSLPQVVYNWLEYALQPLYPDFDPFPPLANVTRTVYITVEQIVNGFYEWKQNGDVWQTSRVQTPYLVSIYENNQSAVPDYSTSIANGGWDPKNLAFPAEIGETLDIVWLNNDGPNAGWDIHPFHAHGGHYWDLGSGNGTYNATANEMNFANYTPVLRDTTMQYRYASSGLANVTAGWRAWRIKARYPGAWMMHCHILQHMIMGMQTVWVFGNASEIQSIPEVYVAGYLQYGGSAYGNATYDPLVYHYYS